MFIYVHICTYIDVITIDYIHICDFTYILYIHIFPAEISELRSSRRSCEVRQVPSRDPCARWLVTARSCRCRCGDGWINAMENMGSLMESGVLINGIIYFFLFWSLVFLFKLILIVLKCSSKFHYNSLFFLWRLCWGRAEIKWGRWMDAIELEYTLWLFNIAMENHHFIAR
jgi:hypothetical protein